MHDTKDLLESMRYSIQQTIPLGKIGIAFSGGVDSTLLAKLCSDLKFDLVLLTIGFSKSHDILFAQQVNQTLSYKHHILEIDSTEFDDTVQNIEKIISVDNLSWIENGIAFYYISKLANSLGIDNIVTANGIDELFCGYNAYREVADQIDFLSTMVDRKITNELDMLNAINNVTSIFTVKSFQPFLSAPFINFAKQLPFSCKIHGTDDLMRKHIIRDAAYSIDIPKLSCFKPKKAMQYGSLIHKKLLKSKFHDRSF